MDAYTGFAYVYDEYMDNIPYEEWGQYMIALLKENGVSGDSSVLELGCGTGTVDLGATPNAGATINWYSDATGGTLLASGTTYTTPSITDTTTYYAAAETSSTGDIQFGTATTTAGTTNLSAFNPLASSVLIAHAIPPTKKFG